MSLFPSALRLVGAVSLLMTLSAPAAPVAVDDTFTIPEDSVAGSSMVGVINAPFEDSGGGAFTLPNNWQIIDLATVAAGGSNTYPQDALARTWMMAGFDSATSTIAGWRSGTLPVQAGGIDHPNFASVAPTLTGLVSGGPNLVNCYLMRNQFTLTAAQAAQAAWELSILADDGCVVYINGVEKARMNFPVTPTLNPDDFNGGATGDEGNYIVGSVDLSDVLVEGVNVVAIELHQNTASSSDAGLDFTMGAVVTAPTGGFVGVDDAFFSTNNPTFAAQTHAPTGGFNGSGALRIQLGNVAFGSPSQMVSGAWRRTFSLASPATVALSFRHRLISGQDYDAGEYQELISDVNGTPYGSVTAPSTHTAVAFQVGNGNGGGVIDSGWKQAAFNISLAAGTHTLTLGGYANAGSAGFAGAAAESFEGFFDDVVLTASAEDSLLANDTGGVAPVTAVKLTNPAHGTATVNPNGTFLYTPEAHWFGTDSFTYRAEDGSGPSAPATVSITVTPVNDLPLAAPDGPYVATEDVPLTIPAAQGVLANDTDVEAAILTASLLTPPAGGVVQLNADGGFTFTPNSQFSGTTTFTYFANDGTASSQPAIVTIQVADVPDAPTSVADVYTTTKNTTLTVSATTAGSTTAELLPLEAADWRYFDSLLLANRNQGTLWRTTGYAENADWKTGAAQLGYGDGDEATSIADNPDPAFDAAASDKFPVSYFRRTLEVTDFYNITGVEVTVLCDDACAFYLNGTEAGRTSGLPDSTTQPELPWDLLSSASTENLIQNFTLPPSVLRSGLNLIAAEVHQNQLTSSDLSFDFRLRVTRALASGVLANDLDPDPGQTATLTALLVAPPVNGSLSLAANGTFTYTPANNFIGTDTFTYRAVDSTNRLSPIMTASISVINPPNAPPTAVADAYSTSEDTGLTIAAAAGLLVNDTDAEGDVLTATVVTPPARGTLLLNPNGSFSYQPNANFSGTDSFTYQALDGGVSLAAAVTLTVTPVNDPPIAMTDAYVGDPGASLTVPAGLGVLANDTDVDVGTTLTAVLATPPAGGGLTLNPDGSFTFNSAPGGTYTFTYRASDGTVQSAPTTVTLSLNAVPSGVADSYNASEDTPLTVSATQGVLANDSDPEGQPLTATVVASVQHGALTLNAAGSFLYHPAPDYHGPDGFTYRIHDGTRQSAPITVSLTVSPVNDAPRAVADFYGVRVDSPLTISASNGVLRNDTDIENNALTAVLVAPPTGGQLTLNADGSFSYTPAAGFSGTLTFSYRASDGPALSALTTVTLNVTTALNTIAITEIMYHPPGASGNAAEFIEIYNYGDAAVDLGGWRFSKGVNYTFPPSLLLAGRGYLAIPADLAVFTANYPGAASTPDGWGVGSSLANGGEVVRLLNSFGALVDEVAYADEGDWAVRKIIDVWDSTNTPGVFPPALDTDPGLEWVSTADPDPEAANPGGGSLQLRNPALPRTSGQNWAAATPTPGAANSAVALTNSAPLISEVLHSPAVPGATQQVFVTARIQDELTTGLVVSVFYRTWLPAGTAPATAFAEVLMADNGQRQDGVAGDGVYGAVIPAQALNTVVEFYVRATDPAALVRTWPAPTLDLAGANPVQNANCLYQVNAEAWTDHRPLYQMVMTGADNASWNAGLSNRTSNIAPNTTVIFRTGNRFEVRYRASVRGRGNSSRGDTPLNLRMDLPNDSPWNSRTGFNLNYKYSYSQLLGSRLFEAAGVPTEKANLVGARINGVNRILDQNGNRTFGYYCDLIPRGGDTIKEWFPGNDDGNGYGKIRGNVRWGVSTLPVMSPTGYPTGGYVNEGYNKQTNAALNDWTDLHAWLGSLNSGSVADFHTVIAGTVDVDEWCRFLALSTIVNHAETNVANGDDDDYSLYFGATDRLARIIAHDLDTCFNLNAIGLGDEIAPANLTIYQCTEPNYPSDSATLPQMDKFYRNSVLGRKYKAALRYYLDTLFAKPTFDATVDQLLDPQWMGNQFTPTGSSIRTHIKAFLDTRRTTMETFLPTAFTATTTLPLQNGLPRTISATELGSLGGKIDPARTAAVTVNGVAVTTNPYGSTGVSDNSWSAGTAITLRPGLNALRCEAWDENGGLIQSLTVSIWYDSPGVNRSGILTASETWTPASGPYNISSSLTVPAGVTLTIQPGTTVYLASGANLTVNAGGTLAALGTAGAGITMARIPSGTGAWGGLIVNGGSAQLSYVAFANNGSTAFHAQGGAVVSLEHLTFRNPAVQFLSLDASSFVVSDCIFPDATAAFEPVHGSGGIAPGGQGIIRRCRFGKALGYNDCVDFTGGNRPGPILQVYDCIFNGSEDDILDLDSTDAWIEGNIFMHCHRGAAAPDSSSAISGGADNAEVSQVTVINNLIYDCDNAVTMKQGDGRPNGNSAVLLNNTIVRVTRTGGIDTGSGVVNFDDENVGGEGKGMYLEGNIIWDVEALARNYNAAASQLTFNNNLLPVAPPAGATASGNLMADPLLNLALLTSPATATAEQVRAALTPQLCSPALGRGPLGRTLGADLSRSGITVQAIPASTWPATVSLAVGPSGSFTPTGQAAWAYGFTEYRYQLDGGAWSAATPSTTPLALTNLVAGSHTLLVEGRNDAGVWQEAPTEVLFTVLPNAPTIVLSEVLADSTTSVDLIEIFNWGTAPANLVGCMISDDPALPAKFTFPPSTPPLPAGGYVTVDASALGFNLDRGGETVRLSALGGAALDTVVFGPQLPGFSIARSGASWLLAQPSPGAPAAAVCQLGSGTSLRLNEWLGSNSVIVAGDFVELYNPDPLPVNLAGFRLSQDFRNQPNQSPLPPLSFIAGSGFLHLLADGNPAAGGDHLSFKISRIRDAITLLNPIGAVVDNVIVLPGNPDVSQGRTPDGATTTTYLALPTPGFSNGSDLTADTAVMNALRLTEIMFDPPGSGSEFLEFKNIGAVPLTITGVNFGSGLTFTFPATTVAAGGYIVITQNLALFNFQYPGVPAVQWTSGRLDNGGESLRIQTSTYRLGILDFRYEGSWYPETRSGASLEIVEPLSARTTWGDRASWQPSTPSPGGPAPFGVLAPADVTVMLPAAAILQAWVSVGAFPPEDISLAWSVVSGPGSVSFTAPANRLTDALFSLPGIYELRLTATGPGGTPVALDQTYVTVLEDYASWATRLLPTASAPNRLAEADPDRDGLANLVEYALGTSPAAPSAGPQLVINEGRLALRYSVSRLLDPSLRVVPQISSDAVTWQEGPGYLTDVIVDMTATITHIATALEPLGTGGRKFIRLKVYLP